MSSVCRITCPDRTSSHRKTRFFTLYIFRFDGVVKKTYTTIEQWARIRIPLPTCRPIGVRDTLNLTRSPLRTGSGRAHTAYATRHRPRAMCNTVTFGTVCKFCFCLIEVAFLATRDAAHEYWVRSSRAEMWNNGDLQNRNPSTRLNRFLVTRTSSAHAEMERFVFARDKLYKTRKLRVQTCLNVHFHFCLRNKCN